jgi:thiol-disulfide isomerase/thioredoxin
MPPLGDRNDDSHGRPARGRKGRSGDGGAAAEEVRTVNVGAIIAVLLVVAIAGALWMTREQWRSLVPGAGPGAEPIATVNQVPVTVRDVDVEFQIQKAIREQLGMQLSEDPDMIRGFRRDLLHELVDRALLRQAAEEAGVTVSPEEVQAELPKLGEGLGIRVEDVQAVALEGGVTPEELDAWLRRSIQIQRYVETDEAREKGLEVLRDRGLSADQSMFVSVKPGDVAAALHHDADIRFYFAEQGDQRAAVEGEPAPDFTLPDLDGRAVALSDFRGQPVMVNFWATWCKPCKVEMPLFTHAYERNQDKGLVVLAVDVQEKPEDVREHVQMEGMALPVVLDREGQASTIYRVRGLPSTFFVDENGVLVEAVRGAIKTRAELIPLLQLILPDAESWLGGLQSPFGG